VLSGALASGAGSGWGSGVPSDGAGSGLGWGRCERGGGEKVPVGGGENVPVGGGENVAVGGGENVSVGGGWLLTGEPGSGAGGVTSGGPLDGAPVTVAVAVMVADGAVEVTRAGEDDSEDGEGGPDEVSGAAAVGGAEGDLDEDAGVVRTAMPVAAGSPLTVTSGPGSALGSWAVEATPRACRMDVAWPLANRVTRAAIITAAHVASRAYQARMNQGFPWNSFRMGHLSSCHEGLLRVRPPVPGLRHRIGPADLAGCVVRIGRVAIERHARRARP
jgi:hypothetical protein